MSDIFREVDDEVRRAQAEVIWKKYGVFIMAAAILLVVGVAGWRIWEWRRDTAAAEAGASYETAVRLAADGKSAEAEAAFGAIASGSNDGYAALARIRVAGERAKRDPVGAMSAFETLAADATLDPALRDLARVRAAAIMVDSAPYAEIASRLEPLTAPGGAWRFTALELLAAAALKAGDAAKAAQHLDAIIVDPAAPQAMRQRAELLIGLARSASQPQG